MGEIMRGLGRIGRVRPCRARLCEFSSSTSGPAEKASARPFQEIPGPKGLPLIGTLYKYLPLIGEYNPLKLYDIGASKYAKYGPLVREEIKIGEPIVFVFRPEDIAEVFKADSKWYPERRSHTALLKYRQDRSHIYNTGGLLTTNGADWWPLRREFQKALSKPQNVVKYLSDTDKATTQFMKLCEKNEFDDTLPLLSRLFLQLTCLVACDLNINVYSEEEMREDSMSSKLIKAAFTANDVIYLLDNGPRLWKYFNTPKYKQLCEAQECMEKIAIQMVSEKEEKLRNCNSGQGQDKESLLEIYLRNPALDKKDVVGMACDMFLAGIDTTTYSSAYALYHLANNPKVQEKLHAEASRLIANENDCITAETLREASYTKAVLKETLRINPISIGVGRILQTDIVLSGYHVPKGTNVVTQNQVSCKLPEYFENPDSFIPERWLRDTEKSEKSSVHPYLMIPFGHGPRSCIARRLAEQNIQVLLLRICRHMKFFWQGGDLEIISTPINKPNVPIKLRFCRR